MKIAVTGSKGRLGSVLVESYGYCPISVDIINREELFDTVSKINPDVIVHCAAFTDVNACEEQKTKALEVNFNGVRNVRQSFKGRMIHLSTDFVFEGRRGPYTERSRDGYPIQHYGVTKYGAEMLMQIYQREFPSDTIVRTTNIFGSPTKTDFIQEMIKNRVRGEFSNDINCTPTYVLMLAKAIDWLVQFPKQVPLIHLAGSTTLTRYEAALEVAKVYGFSTDEIRGVPYSGSVPRGKKVGLRCNYAKKLGAPIYSFYYSLQDYMLREKYL